MATSVYLPEEDIQRYERAQAVGHLTAAFVQMGAERGAGLFGRLLRSYRVTAQVANACWALVADLQKGQLSPETWKRVVGVLSNYALGAPPPSLEAHQYVGMVLEHLYNRVVTAPTREAVLEALFYEMERYRQ